MATRALRSAKAPPSRLPRRSSLPGIVPETSGADVRLYSDVAASRPSSPRGETFSTPVMGSEMKRKPVVDWEGPNDSSEEEVPLAEFTRARRVPTSVDSPKHTEYIHLGTSKVQTQREVVDEAADLLPADSKERNRIQKRQDVVDPEKAKKAKGKTTDPREWGNVELGDDEMDPAIQEAMFENLKLDHDRDRHPKRNKVPETKSERGFDSNKRFHMPEIVSGPKRVMSAGHAHPQVRAGSRPAAQIAPASSVGIALREISKKESLPPGRKNGDSGGDSPSDSSDSENNDNSTTTTDEETSRIKQRRSKKKTKKKKRRNHAKPSIKPIPPTRYDGTVDIRSYYRFIREGEAYLEDGNVEPKRQIRILAHFLDGKAYDFYMQKVAPENPNDWDLHRFFTELYNYCFPIDYKQRTRLKLENLCQSSNQPVSEYIHELQELFGVVGDIPLRFRIIKLWYSLKPETQRIMWKDGLHPDESSWEDVVAKAEMIEISDNVLDPRERQMFPDNQSGKGFSRFNANRGRASNDGHNFPPRSLTANAYASASQSQHSNTSNFRQLTEKEMGELRAAGRCFNCEETGHISQNCPNKNLVQSTNNKPPGIPNYSVEMNLVEDISDSEEVLESLPVGYMGMQTAHAPINMEGLEDDEAKLKLQEIDDGEFLSDEKKDRVLILLKIRPVLEKCQPYPGDIPDVPAVDDTYNGSLVLQVGDCNDPSTSQSLMAHVLSSYLGRVVNEYLDDIIVYTDTLDDDIKRCLSIMDILETGKLYLSRGKPSVLRDELLGRNDYPTHVEFPYHDVTDDESAVVLYDTDSLAGVKSVSAARPHAITSGGKKPKTSKEFTHRMRDKIILKGPKRPEGGSVDATTTTKNISNGSSEASGSGPDVNVPASLPEVILESSAGIDLFKEIKGRYVEDNLFQIIEKPNVSELPKGKGSPSREGPQVFLGAISYGPPPSPSLLRTPDLSLNHNTLTSTSESESSIQVITHDLGIISTSSVPSVIFDTSSFTHTVSKLPGNPDHIDTTNPVYSDDFFVTQEHCGLILPCNTGILEAHELVLEDYATSQAYKNKRRREHFQERDNKRNTSFGKYGSAKSRDERAEPIGAATMHAFNDIIFSDLCAFTSPESLSTININIATSYSSSSPKLPSQPFVSIPKSTRNTKTRTTDDTMEEY
jgi:hypothetical protein